MQTRNHPASETSPVIIFRFCIAATVTQAGCVIATETRSAVKETVVPSPQRVWDDMIKSGVERIDEIKDGDGFRDVR
jgi:hypothetical protein